jgi:two-component system, chemotaxis family, CheB/CheR fusion protein
MSENLTPLLRVLVVDDHPDLLSMLDLMMQRRKYAVRTAQSGPEALELAPDFSPHVVVSDIGMPGMDGYQLMQELRSTPDIGPFRSIALTGYDLKSEADRAKAAGYDAHLSKPIEFDQLFEMIENLAQEMKSPDSE